MVEKTLGAILQFLPLIFAFGFVVPVIAAGIQAAGIVPPFGLSPSTLALILGGLWGVWGVFFAIPLATLVKAIYNAWPTGELERAPPDAELVEDEPVDTVGLEPEAP